jgi:hypothetical protein
MWVNVAVKHRLQSFKTNQIFKMRLRTTRLSTVIVVVGFIKKSTFGCRGVTLYLLYKIKNKEGFLSVTEK